MSHSRRGGCENDCPVNLELRGPPDAVLVQDTSLQTSKSTDLLFEAPVTADHTAKVFEAVDRFQLGAIN